MTIPTLATPQNQTASAAAPNRGKLRKLLAGGFVVAAAIAAFLIVKHRNALADSGKDEAVPQIIAVAKVTRGDLANYLTIAAEFRPYQEVSVHAKVAGYVQSIGVDIGDRVKAGQVLAVLEIPELKDDLNKAQAELSTSQEDVKRAEADYDDVHLAYQRLLEVANNPKLVAQQDVDDARSKDISQASALSASQKHVEECQAEVSKMRNLLDYASITAPFDGVVTRRYADTGALVQAGTASSTQAMPVVDIAQDDLLRLVFPVPESAVSLVRDGAPVEITVGALNRTFTGKITRNADKVDRATRTMETEVDVPNTDGSLTPGMYAYVKLPLEQRNNVVTVPVQAISPGPNPAVFVLSRDNRLEERPVKTGMATASRVEILSGLEPGELVLIGSRAGLRSGQAATGKITEAPEMK